MAPASMQLGMVGLGRMGGNIVRRLLRAGHECVVYDRTPAVTNALADEGATGAASIAEFVSKLRAPRAASVMVPAADITDRTIQPVSPELSAGDIIIAGAH